MLRIICKNSFNRDVRIAVVSTKQMVRISGKENVLNVRVGNFKESISAKCTDRYIGRTQIL